MIARAENSQGTEEVAVILDQGRHAPKGPYIVLLQQLMQPMPLVVSLSEKKPGQARPT